MLLVDDHLQIKLDVADGEALKASGLVYRCFAEHEDEKGHIVLHPYPDTKMHELYGKLRELGYSKKSFTKRRK